MTGRFRHARLGTIGRQSGGLRFNVTEPGGYRVKIPAVAGYEPHEPIEVDAVPGKTLEIAVQLMRLP